MRMIRVVLSMFASVTNGITERTRSLHHGSFNERCVSAFPLFFRSGASRNILFRALQEAT
jgi:hypothetical protein